MSIAHRDLTMAPYQVADEPSSRSASVINATHRAGSGTRLVPTPTPYLSSYTKPILQEAR
jgi:hypothetical protein